MFICGGAFKKQSENKHSATQDFFSFVNCVCVFGWFVISVLPFEMLSFIVVMFPEPFNLFLLHHASQSSGNSIKFDCDHYHAVLCFLKNVNILQGGLVLNHGDLNH